MKPKAIVIDIDGVLLKSDIILKEIFDLGLRGDEMWDYFHQNCNSERVIFLENTLPFLNALDKYIHVVLSTARNDKCRKETEQKLQGVGISFDSLMMRTNGDKRPSPVIKKEHLHQIMQKYEVIAFIDDDLANCEMAKEEGIFALRKV